MAPVRKLAAILSSDVVGYSRLMADDDRGTLEAITATRAVVGERVAAHAGRVVDATGDALLAEFPSAIEAVKCAVEVQRVLATRNAPLPACRQMVLRIGLNLGDVLEQDGALYGDGVNIAARLQAMSEPGGVCISGTIFDQIEGHLPLAFRFAGEQAVKNIPKPVRAYHLDAFVEKSASGRPPPEPRAPATRSRGNLPRGRPPIFGRAADVDALRALLRGQRLVSIVGAGGIGKTSLALEAAQGLADAYRDGAWLVELAPLGSVDLVPGAIAAALNVRLPEGPTPTAALVEALCGKELLLVLDNCEHLVDGVAAATAALLQGCPGVRALATSQEVLRLPEETVYRLDPLAVPAVADARDPMQFSAVELFVHRVRALDRAFALGPDNVGGVVEICRRLDGIALAIEMAASRVPLLGVEGVRARLDERFRLLSAGNRIALRKHQTLRAALDWSHGHLSEVEQVVFRRLGIFAGGFPLGALAEVVADSALDEWEVIERLGSLVDKSLVVAEGDSTRRYRLLETMRAFALERLAASGETATLERKHAQWLDRACEGVLDVSHTSGGPAGRHLEAELDNLRAALDWAFSPQGDTDLGIRLTGCALPVFLRRFAWTEGSARLETARARVTASTPPEVEACLWDGASIHWRNVDHHADLAAAQRAVALWEGRDEARFLRASVVRARALAFLKRFEEAEAILAGIEGRLSRWPALEGQMWNVRGVAAHWTSRGGATEAYSRARVLLERAGDTFGAIVASSNMAEDLAVEGDLERSAAEWSAALERARAFGDPRLVMHVIAHLAGVYLLQGRVDEALPLAADVVPRLVENRYLFWFVPHLALLAVLQGRAEPAARLLGYAETALARIGHVHEPNEDVAIARAESLVKEKLDAGRIAALRAEGAAWSEREAIEALELGRSR